MLADHYLRYGKAVVAACTTFECPVDIYVSVNNITIDNNRVGLVKARLDIELFIRLQLKCNLVRVSKLRMIEVETGHRQCRHLKDKTVVILGSLTLDKLVIGMNLHLYSVNLCTGHTVNLHLKTCTRATRRILTNRVDSNTRQCIRLDGSERGLVDNYRVLLLCCGYSKYKKSDEDRE